MTVRRRRHASPRPFLILLVLAGLLAPLAAAEDSAPPTAGDEKAVALAERLLDALGGREAYERVRHLRFDFFGFRTHHWDRSTGRHRLEGKSREGVAYVVLHDLDSREGEVWLDGEKQDGEERAKWLENAYGAWINDTYWLLMPYKLLDPGVHLSYDGEEELDGRTYDKVKLTFDGVGLTPGDTYWAYLNRDNHLMDRWAYHLQGWEAEREPTHWRWLDWQRHGGILLSSIRENVAEDQTRPLGDIAVFDQLPDTVYDSPEPVSY